ncbi:MAG: hypothetical protein ACK52G_10230 [Betaproteobacteria bacterium]
MAEHDILIRTLDAVGARLQRNRVLRAATGAVLVALAGGILAAWLQWSMGPGAGRGPLGFSGVVLLGLLAGAAVIAWPTRWERASRAAAAREADRRGGTHDLLVSALEFRAAQAATPWTTLVQQRAAEAAAALDPRRLVPVRLPLLAPAAVPLLLVLAGLWSLPPRVAVLGAGEASAAVRGDDAALAGELRALAEEAARRGDEAARAQLDAALAALDQEGQSDAQRRRALDAARDALGRRALETEAQWEQLRRVAQSLEGRPEMREVARALKDRDAARAAEALRKLAEQRGESAQPDQSAGAQSKPEALAEALEGAARETREAQGETSGRFQKAVRGLEELAAKLDLQQRANQAARKLDAKSLSLQRAASMAANRYGQQEGTPSGDGAPDTGSANISGGTMFRMGAVAQEKEASAREGGRAGDASGSAQGSEVVGEQPAPRPKATYQLERIAERPGAEAAEVDDVFYAASRQGEARVPASAAMPVYRGATEQAMSPERITLRHRALVREFFNRPTESSATP